MQGYKGQCELVLESLQRLIASCEARRESLVCEGVHLHLGHIIKLMAAHPSIVPFLIYISNEGKHKERFAVSAQVYKCLTARSVVPSCMCWVDKRLLRQNYASYLQSFGSECKEAQ